MTLGLHETRIRRRRRVRWSIAKWVIGLSAVLAAGVIAYRSGSTLVQREVENLEREIVDLTARVEELQERNTDLRADMILAERRLDEANERYERDVPTGRMAALLGRVQAKLEAGVKLDRIEFLIDSAQNPRPCEPDAATKRFLVQTPLYSGANDSVSFANNTVTITALGESATNAEGRLEAWFDPAKPVTVRFTRIGGKTTEKVGKLPLHTSLVIGDYEYRYSVIAGPRGFVQVTGDRCEYP
ncbi:MAG: coiled-coil domain-containing protein [Kiloniellaceae bacterium]